MKCKSLINETFLEFLQGPEDFDGLLKTQEVLNQYLLAAHLIYLCVCECVSV